MSELVPVLPRVHQGPDPHAAAAGTAPGQPDSASAARHRRAAGGGTGSGWAGATARRHAWRKDRRAMLVAEFLASDEAEDLSDREAASRCADHIVDYGCDRDFGRPLRMSPAKAETFLLDWLPRKIMLSPAEQHAMPHVLAAWVRWAGARGGPVDAEPSARRWMRCSTRWARSRRSTATRPRSAWSRSWSPGCCPTPTWRPCPAARSPSRCSGGGYRGIDLTTLDPAEPADRARRCWPPTTTTRAGGTPASAHRPAPGARRPALARRPAGAVGGGAAPARPGRGPARGAAHADVRDQGRGFGLRRPDRRAAGPAPGGIALTSS